MPNGVFAHHNPLIAKAMGRIVGILRRHGSIPDTRERPAARFIRKKMFRRTEFGKQPHEQLSVIRRAIEELWNRGIIVAGSRSTIKLDQSTPPQPERPLRYTRGRGSHRRRAAAVVRY